jgi:hypothetical protein
MALPDISAQFVFRQWAQGRYSYKEASGELGEPCREELANTPAT